VKRILLYPLWIRFWHWLNALLFIVLVLSGVSLHYSDSGSFIVPFQIAMYSHNIAGVLVTLNYLFFLVLSITSGNIKQYLPKPKGMFGRIRTQIKYYMLGIFTRGAKPYHTTEKQKFNPMQQVTYLFIMGLFMPLIILSGLLLFFPALSPDEIFGMGGVWPMAILHIIVGFLLTVFMLGHIYLGTTGKTTGDLFKSMITGWHFVEEGEEDIQEPVPDKLRPKIKVLPIVFYNPLTIAGALIAIISFVVILFLMVIEYFSEFTNSYMGIVTYVLLPSILIFGLLLIAIGAFKENRRLLMMETPEKRLPIIDLNNPNHQIATLFFTVGSVVLVTFSIIGSFKAFEYTDSDDFCGNICHVVMEPEYTAYKNSPHSHVGCVKCHIGPGTDWFVRSKVSGLYQVYAVLFDKYPKPIETPVASLRPAQGTCEQCHWPKFFYSEKEIDFNFYLSDEKNTPASIKMLLKTGGGTEETGNNTGIHWNMFISNEITYYPADISRMDIPWVRSKNIATGKETVYRRIGTTVPDENLKPNNLRKLDCIDCHNRPSHIYNQPNKTVNSFMAQNRIDPSLPYIKNIAVQALEGLGSDRMSAPNDINNFLWKFYQTNYPDVLRDKKNSILAASNQLNQIFQRNYFPDMRVSWKNFPNNIGHLYSPGCFRCHDGKHVSGDGKVIPKDCNVCHTIIAQKAVNGQPNTYNDHGEINFIHPGGAEKFLSGKNCQDCHGAGRWKMQ
jgi:thiosulfate reductase cytochrome b subunit/nitrate/TMAO reductase-like tetraheme cytochrome c subunit